MKCPVCSNEVTKKWQTGTAAMSRAAQWECGVCGGTFTKVELRPQRAKQAVTQDWPVAGSKPQIPHP